MQGKKTTEIHRCIRHRQTNRHSALRQCVQREASCFKDIFSSIFRKGKKELYISVSIGRTKPKVKWTSEEVDEEEQIMETQP